MTVVNPKSISGINSITMASGSDNLLTIHTTNTTERVRVNSDGDVIVGSGITVSPDGDIFATGVTTSTTFVGALTGNVTGNVTGNISGGTVAGSTGTFTGDVDIADKIIHTGDTNTTIRFPSADTITAETGGTERLRINSTGQTIVGDSVTQLTTSSERPFQVHSINGPKIAIGRNDTSISDGNTIGGIEFYGNDNNGTFVNTASIIVDADGAHGDNDKPTRMLFYTTADGGSSATERLRITSGGDVGIGDNNPSIRLTVVDSGTENLVRLGRSDGSSHGSHTVNIKTSKDFYHNFKMEASSYDLDCYNGSSMIDALSIDTNGQVVVQSGDLRFGSAGSGIVLGNTSNADANTLDDYEEGTFTPTLGATSSDPTVSSYSGQTGRYTKIGNVVNLFLFLDIGAGNITAAGSGDGVIRGLPFTIDSTDSNDQNGAAMINFAQLPNSFSTGRNDIRFKFTAGDDKIRIHQYASDNPQVQTGLGSGQIANGNRFKIGLVAVYRTTQ